MHNITIEGIGTFLPGIPINNDKLAAQFNLNQQWIEQYIGTKTRHFSIDLDTGRIKYNLTDLAVAAANKAFEQASIKPDSVDALILATATPDNLMPATVNLVMEQLGINNKETYQLQSGCSGALQAINLGCKLLQAGNCSRVIVIGADICNKFINLNADFSRLKPSEIINYVLFADGAGALILSNSGQSKGLKINQVMLKSAGAGIAPAQIINWKTGIAADDSQVVFEDYKSIAQRVPGFTANALKELLIRSGWQLSQLNYLLPPQLSKVMTDTIVHSLNINPPQVINCVADTGNNGNALPFLQLERLQKIIQPGEKAIAIAIESSKWILSGATVYA